MENVVLPENGFKEFVHDLAKTHQVSYVQTEDDAKALALYKEMNSDSTDLSTTELLIIALYRARLITSGQMLKIQNGYFKDLYDMKGAHFDR